MVIGVTLPLSGPYQSIGIDAGEAIRFVEAFVNGAGDRNGLVRHRGIRFRMLDDEGDPEKSRLNTETLIREGAVAIVGPFRSAQVTVAQEASFARKIPMVTPYAGAQALATIQPANQRYLFQAITNIQRGSGAAMGLKIDEEACEKTFAIRTDDVTGADYFKHVSEMANRGTRSRCFGNDLPIHPSVVKDTYDAELLLAGQFVGASKGCGVLVAPPGIAGRVLRDYRRMQGAGTLPPITWFGPSVLKTPDFPAASKEGDAFASDGSWIADLEIAEAEEAWLRKAVDPSRESRLSNFFLFTFDAAMLVTLALERTTDLVSSTALRDGIFETARNAEGDTLYTAQRIVTEGFRGVLSTLRNNAGEGLNYDGVTGTLEFDDRGVPGNDVRMWFLRGETFACSPTLGSTDACKGTPGESLYSASRIAEELLSPPNPPRCP